MFCYEEGQFAVKYNGEGKLRGKQWALQATSQQNKSSIVQFIKQGNKLLILTSDVLQTVLLIAYREAKVNREE